MKNPRLIALPDIVSLLAACAVGPDYISPSIELPARCLFPKHEHLAHADTISPY